MARAAHTHRRMQLYALRAPTRRPDVDLTHPTRAPALWQALRRRYPGALSGVISRGVLELIVPAPSPGDAQRSLAACLSRVAREVPLDARAFLPVPEVRRLEGRDALRRALVEQWSAPVRRGGVSAAHEPLWSSFRDVMGASALPWVTATTLSRALDVGHADIRELLWTWTHGRSPVSAPPTPVQARAALLRGRLSSHELVLAAAAATRAPVQAIRHPTPTRRLLVWLALELKVASPTELVELCGTDESSVRRISRVVEGRSLDAGLMCAADPRLTLALRGRTVPMVRRKASA